MYYCFFFNDTATTEIYTLSLHDALPILDAAGSLSSIREPGNAFLARATARRCPERRRARAVAWCRGLPRAWCLRADRKSTRLNSSHDQISYAVFCLKKKNKLMVQ